MKRRAHMVMGVGLVLAAVARDAGSLAPALLMGAMGSIAPDFDILYKHRKLLHNVFAASLATIIVLFTCIHLGASACLSQTCASAFLIGWLSHLLGDMVTRGGVAALWPLSGRRLRVSRMRYDDPRVSIVGYGVGLAGLAAWLARSSLIHAVLEALNHAPRP